MRIDAYLPFFLCAFASLREVSPYLFFLTPIPYHLTPVSLCLPISSVAGG